LSKVPFWFVIREPAALADALAPCSTA
jgi:hypothetical protein